MGEIPEQGKAERLGSRPRLFSGVMSVVGSHGRSKIGDLVGVVPDDGWAAFRCRVWSWSPGGWALSAL
jgi:hypothetical protein